MQAYLDLLRHVMETGEDGMDRTGTGTRSVFSYEMRFDLREGFPLVTTKRIHLKSIIHENLWFIAGDTNIRYLQENGVTIWDEWADANGDLGPVSGEQWRRWQTARGETIDQLADVIEEIRRNPDSRRLIVTAWNPGDLNRMALAPCHCLFQFRVRNGKISLKLTQRSADVFLGVPFNIASYAMLLQMVAAQTGLVAHEFIWSGGDVHIYHNHFEQVRKQLTRAPHPLPRLWLNPEVTSIFDYRFDDVRLETYVSDGAIPAPVAV